MALAPVSITRPGKHSLTVAVPVLNSAGTLGFADEARDLIALDALGAFVTNPITASARAPAAGARVVQLDAGLLVHTGLPNPGLGTAMKDFRGKWARFPVPVVLHLVAHSPDEMRRMIGRIEEAALEGVSGIEVGISDDATTADAAALVRAAAENGELPVLARLPFASTGETAHALADAGADGLVACAPPRGTARDRAGRLIPGRLYGPLIKPLMLRLVGQIARQAGIPVVGAGGIHSTADARDYLDAGAAAVAIDSAVWVRPRLAAAIAADLGGDTHTQPGETAD